jgi:cell division protein FtsN
MWHRVRLGSFSNKAAAERLQKSVRDKEGLSTIVVLE